MLRARGPMPSVRGAMPWARGAMPRVRGAMPWARHARPTAQPTATLPGAGAKLPGALLGDDGTGRDETGRSGRGQHRARRGGGQPPPRTLAPARGPCGAAGGPAPGGEGGVAGGRGAGSPGARWPVDAAAAASKDLPGLGRAGAAEPAAPRSQPPAGAAAAPWPYRGSPTGSPPPLALPPHRGAGGGQRRGVRTGLRAASSGRLRPHRRGVGAGSRGDPEGPARLPRDRAPTGPGEQEWLGPSPAPGSSLLPRPSSTPPRPR